MKKIIYLNLLFHLFLATSLLAQTDKDIALIIDGSGSIDGLDFTNQLSGLRVLLSSDLIPANGSIGLTVVQFGASAQVEIPYTVITSSNINQVGNDISDIDQIGGGTNVGAAIRVATDELADNGSSSALQVMALSVDGTNNGETINTQYSIDRGIDRLGIIGISCPHRGFTEQVARDAYESVVFGGGSFAFVQDVIDFANTIVPFVQDLLAPTSVRLVGIEAIQSIQNFKNEIPLVAFKRTFVRVLIEDLDNQNGDLIPGKIVTGTLRGYRDGVPFDDSPRSPMNNPSGIYVGPEQSHFRERPDAYLWFDLPLEWLTGQVDVRFETIGNLICDDRNNSNPKDCMLDLNFVHVDPIEIELVMVQVTDSESGTVLDQVTEEDVTPYIAQIKRMFPFSISQSLETTSMQVPITEEEYNAIINAGPNEIGLDTYMLDELKDRRPNTAKIYIALYNGKDNSGLADSNCFDNTGTYAVASTVNEDNNCALCHELGHLLGLHHPTNENFDNNQKTYEGIDPKTQLPPITLCGPCGSQDYNHWSDNFPNWIELDNDEPFATIGSDAQNTDVTIWGIDEQELTIDPSINSALMSYCVFRNNRKGWLSNYNFNSAMTSIINRNNVPKDIQKVDNLPSIYVYATIRDGNILVRPFSEVSESYTYRPSEGPKYSLLQHTNSGEIIETPLSNSYTSIERGTLSYITLVGTFPKSPDIRKVQIIKKSEPGTILFERVATDNEPILELNDPINRGNNNDSIRLAWNATDLDNDDLIYSIDFSHNNGQSWNPVITKTSKTDATISKSVIKNSQSGFFRVTVTDGFNTDSEITTTPIVVEDGVGKISILHPRNENTYYGSQLIRLEALNTLTSTGVGDFTYEWTSDVDGALANGHQADLSAQNLTEGNHIISLKAIDIYDNTFTSNVEVLIARLAPPPKLPEAIEPEIVPTMGQWAIIASALLLLIVGVIAVKQKRLTLS